MKSSTRCRIVSGLTIVAIWSHSLLAMESTESLGSYSPETLLPKGQFRPVRALQQLWREPRQRAPKRARDGNPYQNCSPLANRPRIDSASNLSQAMSPEHYTPTLKRNGGFSTQSIRSSACFDNIDEDGQMFLEEHLTALMGKMLLQPTSKLRSRSS